MKTVQISGTDISTGETVVGDGRTERGDRVFLHVEGREVEVESNVTRVLEKDEGISDSETRSDNPNASH